MAQTNYKRRLVGSQAGVAVHMPVDRTNRFEPDVGDQTVSCVGHFSRGRIDKAFLVPSTHMARYLGQPKSMRLSPTNETYIQLYEAFKYGAAAAVVSRVVSSQAYNGFVIVKKGADDNIIVSTDTSNEPDSSDNSWLAAFKFADCINEGFYFTVQKGESDDELTIMVYERQLDATGRDTLGGELLYEFTGSLNPEAKNDFGESAYLADVANQYYPDWIDVLTNYDHNKTIEDSDAFFNQKIGLAVTPFVDNGLVDNEAYIKAAKELGNTVIPYRYIISESHNLALVVELMHVAQQYNRIMVQAVSGNFKTKAAIAFKDQFQYDPQGGMYAWWVWSPIKRDDLTRTSGNMIFATVGQKAGYACARNAVLNGYGLPALNQPIAGKDYPIQGTRISQVYHPSDVELAALAKAHINPVLLVRYHDGDRYVWDDSLSGAKKTGISRLESAVEISCFNQDLFGKYARSLLQKPMTEALRLMKNFCQEQLSAQEASGWLTPSPRLDGRAFQFSVEPNGRDPDTIMDVELHLSIDGVVRVINIKPYLYSR